MNNRNPPESPFLEDRSYGTGPREEHEGFDEALLADNPFNTALAIPATLEFPPVDERESTLHEAFAGEVGVIDKDNRVRITATTAIPFRWICRVDIKGARDTRPAGGTGVLVSDRHVLTAAHVVYDAFQNMQNFSIQITPGLNYGDEPLGSYSVTSKPRLPRNYKRDDEDSLDWDYALLRLDKAIGTKTFSALQGKPLCHWGSAQCGMNSVFARPDPKTLNGKSAFTAGYPRSAGARKLMCAAGILVSVAPTRRTMRITADTTQGQSGSPVWIVDGKQYCLVGIAAGAGTHTNVVVRVTRELVRQLRAWISEDGDSPSMIEAEALTDSPGVTLEDPYREEQSFPEDDRERFSGDEPDEEIDEEEAEDLTGDREADDEEVEEAVHAEESEKPLESFADAPFDDDLMREVDVRDLESSLYRSHAFDSGETALEDSADEETDAEAGEAWDIQETEGDDDLEAGADDDLEFALDLEEPARSKQPAAVAVSPTLGFEFDLNYGFEPEVAAAMSVTPPSGWKFPSEGLRVTEHEWKNVSGGWQDAIDVKLDAVRLEISTAPIHINDDAEFNRIVTAVANLGDELQKAPKKRDDTLTVPGFDGHPTTFSHARTVVNKPEVDAHGNVAFPGDAAHATYTKASVPLVVHRVKRKYPTATRLWASPQATVTLPLSEFGALVWNIHKTAGGAAGVAFTGRSSDRLGLRDDLAWLAFVRAVADRKRRIGETLSDGSNVSAADFTRALTSLVTILVMYMLTGVKEDSRDREREAYAKGSLPLNVKTPLWQIHKFALTDREKLLFKELYGATGQRARLYALALPGATSAAATRKLFPEYTRVPDVERFFPTPTWQRLVEAVIDEKPMVVENENRIAKKKHKKGDEILIAPLSSKIDWDKTKPLIAVEMRRMGFAPVAFEKWSGLMQRVRLLAKKVNP